MVSERSLRECPGPGAATVLRDDFAAERAGYGAGVDHDRASVISTRKVATFLNASAQTVAHQLALSAAPI